MTAAIAVVQMVSRLRLTPNTLRVTLSPTGMLPVRTPATLSIGATSHTNLLALVLEQRDQCIEQHQHLEEGQTPDDAPTDGLIDHQQPDCHGRAQPEPKRHAPSK